MSGRSNTIPSIDTSSRPAQNAFGVNNSATGTAIRSNSSFTGSYPNRCRAWVIPPEVGSFHDGSQFPSRCIGSASFRITPS